MAGNDTLGGAAGNDTLVGGLGADVLRGRAGADVFRYLGTKDSSGLIAGSSDTVSDFVSGQDAIDLTPVDADTHAGGHQHFAFLGSAAFGADATGELRFEYDSAHDVGRLMGSTDADADAEIVIVLAGVSTFATSDVVR